MRLNVATVNTVIAALKDVFSHHGIPETVMSDYLPQHSCALLKNFASEYGFTHITSSPGYSQENGEAERAVATVKGLPNFLLGGQALRGSEKQISGQKKDSSAGITCIIGHGPYPDCSRYSVWLPREKSEGTVIRQAQTPSSYIVHTDEGLIRRNHIHMWAVHPPCEIWK